MSVNLNEQDSASSPVFELKASSFTLPLLRLFGTDLDVVAEQLGTKVNQAPEFFHNAPVVIDLKDLKAAEEGVEFPLLVGLLRGFGMIPVGVRGGTKAQNAAAEAMELAILGDSGLQQKPAAARQHKEPPKPLPKPTATGGSKLVMRPIRSGQRVYVRGGDLTVIGPVSSGAEIMADGNIHVYGPLRGRALAGVRGNREVRIFCQQLQAELVSVAGHYRISENIEAELKGQRVQIYLQERTLHIVQL